MRLLTLFLAIVFLSGCGTIDRALNIYESSVDNSNPSQNQQISAVEKKEQIIVRVPNNLHVRAVNTYDLILSWDATEADHYIVYRAWSYPQNEGSYRRVGETIGETYYVEDAYWSGMHYYTVCAVIDGVESELSSYIKFVPQD